MPRYYVTYVCGSNYIGCADVTIDRELNDYAVIDSTAKMISTKLHEGKNVVILNWNKLKGEGE